MSYRRAPSAQIADSATLGDGTAIWHLAQVREDAVLGENCIIGRGAYIGTGVQLGDNCKVQNYALVYEPARLGNGVFIGPAVVLTNDTYPRAINPDGSLKSASDWEPVGVTIDDGAAIGARAVCVAPVTDRRLGDGRRRFGRHPRRARPRARGRRARPPASAGSSRAGTRLEEHARRLAGSTRAPAPATRSHRRTTQGERQ